MTTINNTFINAILADATYVHDIDPQIIDSDLKSKLSDRMTPALAEYISKNFTVVVQEQSGDYLGSGFDATVWRQKDGKLLVSMRGTEPGMDLLDADIDLALNSNARNQLADMVNWWLRITTPVGETARQIVVIGGAFFGASDAPGTGQITGAALAGGIEVNGHSLGGYLASAFTRLFGVQAHVSHTSTFNSAGFAPGSESVFQELEGLVGLSYGLGRFPNGLEQSNYFAKYGINVTTNSFWFSQYGTRVELFNEEGITLPNHYMYKMTDALALGAALEKLDTTLDNSRLIRLLEVGSNKVDASIEGLLDGVRRMLLGPTSPATPAGDVSGSDLTRVQYHQALKQLTDSPVFNSLVGKVLIHPAGGALASNARNNFSALVALQDLSPVYLSAINPDADAVLTAALKAIRPLDYNAWAADKGTTTPATFTNEWIADRAALLQAIVFRNTTDLSSASVEDPAAHAGQVTRIEFVDPTAPTSTVTVTTQQPGTLMLPEQFIAFGGDRVDILTGTSNSLGDHLYGGAGNDTLKGLGGDDRLEGGADSDTLIGGDGDDILVGGAGPDSVQGGKGYDTYIAGNGDAIKDVDGQGSVQLNDSTLTGGLKKSGSSFYLGTDGTRYMLAGNNHSVRILGTDGQTFTASSETGRFTVRHIYTKHYINDVYSGTSFRMEGDPSQCPLGIVLISEETREDRRRVPVRTGGGDPLALDLDGNGLQTLNMTSSNVLFDNDHNGLLERTGWLSGGDGFLVLDLNNNQKIDNGTELFGDGTLLKNGQIAPDGFVALAEYDTNNDLRIDVQDGSIWDSLQVWRDANTNGLTDAGELMSMVVAGVKSIDVGHLVERTDIDEGNLIFKHGTFTKTDDTTAATGDILFATTSSGLISNISGEEDDIAELPNLGGSGDVASLHTAMRSAGGATLKSLVQQFLGSDSAAQRTALADQIVLVWMGTAADEADSGNGRMNATLAWTGRTLNAREFIVDWENQYLKLREWVEGSLLLESVYKDWYGLIDYKLQGNQVSADMTRWLTQAATERAHDAAAFDAKAGAFMRALVSLDGWEGLNLPLALARAMPTLDATHIFYASGYELTLTDSVDNLFRNTPPDQRIVMSAPSTVTFDAGSGRDTLADGSTALDTVHITGVLPDSVRVETNPFRQLVLKIRDSNATLTLQINQGYTDAQALKVVFDDGTTWDWSMVVRRAELENLYGVAQILSGTGQAETITVNGATGVLVYAGVGSDTVTTGSGNDVLMGEAGDDTLDGGTGDDTLDGGRGTDTYHLGVGTGYGTVRWRVGDDADKIAIKPGLTPTDVKVLREGDDLRLMLPNGADSLRLSDWYAQDRVSVASVNFAGGQVWTAADLSAQATITTNSVYGDRIVGTAGDDRMSGGVGNDTLSGGAGNDTYLFGHGDGQDVIAANYGGGGLDNDKLLLKSGVSPSDVTLSRDGYDGNGLRIAIRGTTDHLIVKGWYGGATHDVKQIVFVDGTVWDRAVIESRLSTPTTEDSDVAWGAGGDDTISGLGGDDQLHGDNGNDTLSGGVGSDWLSGGAGNDTLYGGADADSLDGDGGNDVLDGGAGDDTLSGGTGNDIYRFGRGDGKDVVRFAHHDPALDSAWVELKAGVVPADVALVRGMADGSDFGRSLVLLIKGTPDQLEIAEWFGPNGSAVQGVRFADGTIWNQAAIVSRLSLAGTNGPEHLWGLDGDDSISGLAGDDQLHGEEGNDTLSGGNGDDKLYGGAGSDVLDGGSGTDTLDGGAGSDTYRFGRDSGNDVVSSWQYGATPELEWVELKAGVAPGDVTLVRSDANGGYAGTSLMVRIQGTSDQLEIASWFGSATSPVQGLRFADGTVWDRPAIESRLSLAATEAADRVWGADGDETISGLGGDDNLNGEGGNDTLLGGADADSLNGGNGSDILDGGTGDDILSGGAGSDIYRFGRGDGKDVVQPDYRDLTAGSDWIDFKTGVVPADLILMRGDAYGGQYGTGLIVQIRGTTDQLEIADWFGLNPNPVGGVRFVDGTAWDRAAIESRLSLAATSGADHVWGTDRNDTIAGLGGDDQLHGEGGSDALQGGAGNDVLNGGAGDDMLDGGAGQDVLSGGAGNDTYRFGRGSGQDSIENSLYSGTSEMDRLQLLTGVADTDVVLTRTGYRGGDLMVGVRGTADNVLVRSWFEISTHPLQQVMLASGTTWNAADMLNHLSYEGSAGDDTLWGNDQANQMQGGAGRDSLFGNDGDDLLDGGAGNDFLDGGNGADTYRLYRGAGSDTATESWYNTDVSVDQVAVGAGIAPQDLLITRDLNAGDALKIAIIGTADSMTLPWWFDFTARNRIEQLRFADGTVWNANDIQQHIVSSGASPGLPAAGTEVADHMVGSSAQTANTSDWLQGMGGDDVLLGGSGNDRLEGGVGNDVLTGGAGTDTLDGGVGNDTLIGGVGDDTILAGTGADTVVFARGAGLDTVYLAGSTNILNIDLTAVTIAEAEISRAGNDLEISIQGTADKLNLVSWFAAGWTPAKAATYTQLTTTYLSFANGVVLDAHSIWSRLAMPTEGSDDLIGDESNEVINGLAGNDMIKGEGGDDWLIGGAHDDSLDGGTGNDTLDGGTGDDFLIGGYGDDTYVFGLGYGRDVVTDVDGTDVIKFGPGLTAANMHAWRDASNLYINATTGADVLTVRGWFDSMTINRVESVQFSDGLVWNATALAAATFDGTAGPDTIYGSVGDSVLYGFGGDDHLWDDSGDDLMDGGAGNDTLDGGTGNDCYVFGVGYGQDTVTDVEGADVIKLGPGLSTANVALWRDASNLYVGIANSTDVLSVQGWFVATSNRVESIQFSDSTIWGTAVLEAAKFVGTEGPDYMTGGSGSDVLEGRGGDDSLMGDAGADTLDGGTGRDGLDGGVGNDRYIFGRGYGQDTILDTDATAGNLDTVVLKSGVAVGDVTLSRDASNLYLAINGTEDKITITGWYDDAANRIERIEFSDGTVWDAATLAAAAFGGTAGADALYGTTGNDTLLGFGGDDSLNGDAGNDTLNGGAGSDVMDGGAGDDVLTGGTDSDTLDGGTGNDRYLFARGDGQDTIHETDSTAGNSDTIVLTQGIAVSDVTLSRDASNLYLAISGTTDKITVSGWYDDTANRVERIEFADGTVWEAAVMAAAKLSGTEGPDYLSGSAGNDALEGRGGNDTLTTDAGDDTLDGGTGNDSLDGGTGNDSYLFGLGYGQDTISDADGVDVIKLGAGVATPGVELWRDASNLYLGIANSTDLLTVQGWFDLTANRVESVQFADGTVWNAATLAAAKFVGTAGMDYLSGTTSNDVLEGRGGDDTLAADAGDDTLDGGTGVDSLDGAAGNDSYLFGLGYGQDTITDAAGTDVIKLGVGVAAANVQMWRDTSNLYLGLTNSTDVLTVQGWFDLTTNRVESVQFADGTIWNSAALAAAAFGGTPGPDSIYGTTGNDTLLGFGGDDSITGDTGNDTLDGGTGSDTLDGGAGNDGYLFGMGYGQDSITDASGTDVIKLGAGLTTANVQLWRDTSALYLGITGSADVLTVQGWFDATTNRVESVQFADGTIWNATALAAAAFGGTPGADSIYGTTGNNTLYGFGGNDSIYADAGNDVLDGGTGDDMLDGGAGNDTYKFGRGYGLDTVAETSGSTDLIQFDANTAPTDVLVSRDASHLYLSILGTTDKITIQNWYADAAYRVEQVSFAGGTNWTVANLNAKTTTATEAADFYWGTTGNDTVNGLGGDDQLMGNEGNDALSGGAGNDVLNGGTGTDTLLGGMGDDSYVVDATTDVVTENAGEGNDTVRTSVAYTLGANLERLELLEAGGAINGTGNGLANTLVGNTANNTLNGGAGADTLIGGVGNDTFVVDDAADVTTENLSEGTDLVNASLSWTLSANVEKLTLTGTAAINGTGNELANTLTGNSAANVLTGGAGNDALNGAAGADTLIGGLGNDGYTVDNAADMTTENPGEGTDTVSANRSWTLGANLENLTLTGSTLINATGNELNNVLTGNSAANVLTGGLGSDTLKGLAGNDQYVFGRGMGADLVQENDATVGNTDLLQFLSGVAIAQVWLRKVSNDLEVSIIGTTDKVTFTNWYLGSQYHVEQFKTSDGKTLADTDVQNLVTAMAGYAPPAEGQLTLPTDYWTALSSVITANWH